MGIARLARQIDITWTNNKSQPIYVADYRNIGITGVGSGNLQVLGSKMNKTTDHAFIPDFTQPSTIDNSYAAIVIADETTPNTYVTTLPIAGTKVGEVNTNYLGWICVTRDGSGVDAFVTLTDNR